MSFWRKEYDHKRNLIIYHCDEHGFHTTSKEEAAEHEKVHGMTTGWFRF